jgi:hypothetical protein
MTGRTVTARVTYRDRDYGTIGPFVVASPWWADVAPVVEHLRAELGVNVVVLRLVDVEGGTPPRNGHVTYHVEALQRPPGAGITATAEGPVAGRAAWATADGVRAALRWAGADEASVQQVKTWNLSALFRMPGEERTWLKLTPPFAAHEPAVTEHIAAVGPSLVVPVLASDAAHRRSVLAHIPGEDCWDASGELIRATVTRWVAAQAAIALRAAPPSSVVPDRRPVHLIAGLAALLDGEAGAQLTAGELRDARDLLARLPAMIAELEACGLPNTLVHGDFHPGNWRSDGEHTVLIDFADAYVGHPVFDGERLRDFLEPHRQADVVDAWCTAWSAQVPGSDPVRALELGRPLQAIAGAILYQMFLDHIEPSERRYHEEDPPAGIRAALAALDRL